MVFPLAILISNGKSPVRCKITEGSTIWRVCGKKDLRDSIIGPGIVQGKKSQEKAHMARKGNPISVRLDQNRSSDSSRFSEGDRESHRMAQSFPAVCPRLEREKSWEDVADARDGHDFF